MRQEEKIPLLISPHPSPLPPHFLSFSPSSHVPPHPPPWGWLASSCLPVSQPKGARKVCGPEEVKGEKRGGPPLATEAQATQSPKTACKGDSSGGYVFMGFPRNLLSLPPQSLKMKRRALSGLGFKLEEISTFPSAESLLGDLHSWPLI